MSCEGRCSGCALKPGAKANKEPVNRLTAILCSFGGLPFYCHEQFGWTPDQPDYPTGQERIHNSINNLLSAPQLVHNSPELGAAVSDATATGLPQSIFDSDRALIGRHPHCQGWRAAVKRLAAQGWFRDPEVRKLGRTMAQLGLKALEDMKASKDLEVRKAKIKTAGEVLKFFAKEARRDGIIVQGTVEAD